MRFVRSPFRLVIQHSLSCLACFVVLACQSAQEATHQELNDCITELEALGGHGRSVSWESVVEVLRRHASEFREIDGGTEAGVTFYEYEMKISGNDYWVDTGGLLRGTGIRKSLEIGMVTFREGLATNRGKVVAEVNFRD